MRTAKNPPSFIVVDSVTGRVGYTKRATGMGNEAIASCAAKAREIARKTGHSQIVVLELFKRFVGQQLNVGMLRVMGITEEIHPDGSVTRNNPRRAPVRRNIYTFNNPVSGPADQNAARELELYIENDADLYRQQYIPIVKNLMLKRQKGTYNRELAVKLFMYLMDAGAKKYVREFGTGGNIDTMFNKNTRMAAARSFRDSFEGEAGYGNWDHLLVRPTTRGLGATIARKGASTEFEMDMGMFEKGYRYKLIPKSKAFDPLYAKSVYDVPKVMREYPHETFTTVDLSPPRSAHENPGRVRKNIYTFNNPRKLNAMERAASLFGLAVTTWAPGDGVTRYRFFKASGHGPYADYHQGGAIYTANGRGEALKFLKAYGVGRSRMNPLNRSEVAHAARVARRYQDISRRAKPFNREAAAEAAGVSVGMGSAVALFGEGQYKRVGHKIIHRTAEMELGLRKNPCSNPVCRNPKHKHVRKNPLLQTIMLANPPASPAAQKRQMVALLKKEFRHLHSDINSKDAEFDIEGAIYWFANDYHGGGGSALYSILSTSPFKPGPSVRGPEDGFEKMMYETLEREYAGKKPRSNPPISEQWDRLTGRQRLQVLGFVGFEDTANRYVRQPWNLLSNMVKQALEQYWNDTSATRGTTRRRAAPVGANPLTRKESGQILARAKRDLELASSFRGGHTRSARSGMAQARGSVVRQYGPTAAIKPATKIMSRAATTAGTAMSNPGGLRLPAPGTKMTVAQAMELARRIGDRSLIQQCQKAARLQKASDRETKCVVWKHLPLGSPNKIDTVVAMTHYGTSPEDMYKPPSGSKKGNHMYRHTWKKGVPVLASPSGKAIIKVMGPGQKVGDWMRG